MIHWRAQRLSTRRHGTLDHRVGVVDVKMDDEAAGRIRGRGMNVELRELVRQHEDGAAQLQLDVADAAAGLDETELLAGPENALVEVHRLLRGPGAQIDEELVQDRKSTRLNPVTNAHLVCRLLLEKKKTSKPPQ